ncbi:hypothetical protein [Variovorax soli]|uniref:hypothetical protein n=1 Tax=Variovorax soli TaxID=376815 RepID=UPI000837CEDB|nr:hypothetical protein [Variovorax soli]
MSNPDAPLIDERLTSATNTSNLHLDTREGSPTSDADVITAAGWTSKTVEYVIGRNLMALHSEWDRAEHPRMPKPHDIERIAAGLPSMVDIEVIGADGGKTRKSVPRLVAAKIEAEKWFDLERLRLLGKLKTLPAAQAGLVEWATMNGIEGAAAKVRSVLFWWLDHQCPRCNGTKYEVVPGTNRQSNRTCPPAHAGGCNGVGERPLPHGKDGRQIEAHMIECVHRARQKIRKFTSHSHIV